MSLGKGEQHTVTFTRNLKCSYVCRHVK